MRGTASVRHRVLSSATMVKTHLRGRSGAIKLPRSMPRNSSACGVIHAGADQVHESDKRDDTDLWFIGRVPELHVSSKSLAGQHGHFSDCARDVGEVRALDWGDGPKCTVPWPDPEIS